MRAFRWALIALLVTSGCKRSGSPSTGTPVGSGPAATPLCVQPPAPPPPNDQISYTRLLRRVTLDLTGLPPTPADYELLLQAASDADRETLIQSRIDAALAAPAFYDQMVLFGHDWLRTSEYSAGAEGDAYQGNMSGDLGTCGSTTKHPGAWYSVYEYGDNANAGNVCNDQDVAGNALAQPLVNSVTPWWAPSATVTVVGKAGTTVRQVQDPAQDAGVMQDCGLAYGGYYDPGIPSGCGCGPNLVWCFPGEGLSSSDSRSDTQRRAAWDEPARFFGHLAWYDRPLSDLVLANYSVGNNLLRALYVRLGRQNPANAAALDADSSWWMSSGAAPQDPEHPQPGDPAAWREFVVERLSPNILSLTPDKSASGSISRTLQYDPRTTTAPAPGIPAAGVLTMMGTRSAFARERPSAARALEIFACMNFVPPPADQQFNAFNGDPATSGTCQFCHQVIDPAAIHFKRWDFGQAYYVPWPFMPGVGPWRVTPDQLGGQYPYDSNPYVRWRDTFVPGTVLTPITPADLAANPEAVFLDTLPPNQTLLGQQSDGTMGPLGFAKILINSGAFDACATQRLYERFIGRPIDPIQESGYLGVLTQQFVSGGRQLRPFVRNLLGSPDFRRGL